MPFGVKNSISWARSALLHGIYCILQICDYALKQRICRENCKYAFDDNFHGHFCPRRKAAKFCYPARGWPVSMIYLLQYIGGAFFVTYAPTDKAILGSRMDWRGPVPYGFREREKEFPTLTVDRIWSGRWTAPWWWCCKSCQRCWWQHSNSLEKKKSKITNAGCRNTHTKK